jgi:hypothetical protein
MRSKASGLSSLVVGANKGGITTKAGAGGSRVHAKTISEYKMVREEIVRVQDCITEYMKMYFGAGVFVIGAVWYLARNHVDTDHHSSPFLPEWAGGYVFAALSYIILAFATIVFHKFNTHNRYAGYARLLQYEELSPLVQRNCVHTEIYLWEAILAYVYNENEADIPDDVMDEYKERLAKQKKLFETYKSVFKFPGTLSKRILLGFWMMFRSTILKRPTKSWTYPYQIAFGLAITSSFTLFIWAHFMTAVSAQVPMPDMLVQDSMFAHIIICWCGLSHRLFRLCGDDGDRTIEAYTVKFMEARYVILGRMGFSARYL